MKRKDQYANLKPIHQRAKAFLNQYGIKDRFLKMNTGIVVSLSEFLCWFSGKETPESAPTEAGPQNFYERTLDWPAKVREDLMIDSETKKVDAGRGEVSDVKKLADAVGNMINSWDGNQELSLQNFVEMIDDHIDTIRPLMDFYYKRK